MLTRMTNFSVLIVGGGIGGLCLAHGLRRAGIAVDVYERTTQRTDWLQGYRIHIDAQGHRALADCLPERLFELYLATSTRPPRTPLAVFFDHRFERIRVADTRAGDLPPDRAPTAVNRLTLRQVLLAGLGDVVRFGHELVSFDHEAGGVVVRFANGEVATGDVLVAADGINSLIRQRMLPWARLHDTGVRAVNGKTLLANAPPGAIDRLRNGFNGVHGPGFRTLALGLYESRRPHHRATTEFAPGADLDPVADYLMWLQLARVEDFPVPEDRFWSAQPAEWHRMALDMLDGWHPDLRRLVEAAEPDATFPLAIRALLPVPEWTPGPVTLLGDAIHAMTPIGGRGGNTALQDAALLGDRLVAAQRGDVDVVAGIGEYEARMREYGYLAVEQSLRQAAPSLGARTPYDPAPAGSPA